MTTKRSFRHVAAAMALGLCGATARADDYPEPSLASPIDSPSPVVKTVDVNGQVIEGSLSGELYVLDGATGATRWSANVGAGIPGPDEQNVSQPLTGLGAGENTLVVPAGDQISAFVGK